jgi:hypothetical protein
MPKNSQESSKELPEDYNFKNSVVSRLSNLEAVTTSMINQKQSTAKDAIKRKLGNAASNISGLNQLKPFTSQLGKPTKTK